MNRRANQMFPPDWDDVRSLAIPSGAPRGSDGSSLMGPGWERLPSTIVTQSDYTLSVQRLNQLPKRSNREGQQKKKRQERKAKPHFRIRRLTNERIRASDPTHTVPSPTGTIPILLEPKQLFNYIRSFAFDLATRSTARSMWVEGACCQSQLLYPSTELTSWCQVCMPCRPGD